MENKTAMVQATQIKVLRSTRVSGPTARKTAKALSTMTMGRGTKVHSSKVRDRATELLTTAARKSSIKASGIKANNQVRASTFTPQASSLMRDHGYKANSTGKGRLFHSLVKRCIKAYSCLVCRHQLIIIATENLIQLILEMDSTSF